MVFNMVLFILSRYIMVVYTIYLQQWAFWAIKDPLAAFFLCQIISTSRHPEATQDTHLGLWVIIDYWAARGSPQGCFQTFILKYSLFCQNKQIFGHPMVATRYISGPLNHQRSLYYNHVTISTPFALGKIIFSAVKCDDCVFWVEVFNNSDQNKAITDPMAAFG